MLLVRPTQILYPARHSDIQTSRHMADAMVRTPDSGVELTLELVGSTVHEWRPLEPAYKLCTNMFPEMFNSLSLTNADHVVFNTVQSTFLQIIAQINARLMARFKCNSEAPSLLHYCTRVQFTLLS